MTVDFYKINSHSKKCFLCFVNCLGNIENKAVIKGTTITLYWAVALS